MKSTSFLGCSSLFIRGEFKQQLDDPLSEAEGKISSLSANLS